MTIGAEKERVITVGGNGSDVQGFTCRAIQQAVDAISSLGGGTVKLDGGTFAVIGPIRLRSGVTLIGQGESTVLRKSPGFASRLVMDADYGQLQVNVDSADGFEAGMGIRVYDDEQQGGWDESTALITSVEGNTLFIDTYLSRDYQSDSGGWATNACSIIEAIEVNGVHIRDLAIDGSKAENGWIGGCRGGGIYLSKAKDCSIERVTLSDFNGDGISWQITEDITVRDCEIRGCAGSGLHPGAGALRAVIERCVCRENGDSGLFVCWRVQHGTIRDNRFYRNGRYGICIGHQDSDNRFENNSIGDNGLAGISFRQEKATNGANRNVWSGNAIEDNGSDSEGYGIYAEGYSRDNRFENNVIRDTGSGRQRVAVRLEDSVEGFVFVVDGVESSVV